MAPIGTKQVESRYPNQWCPNTSPGLNMLISNFCFGLNWHTYYTCTPKFSPQFLVSWLCSCELVKVLPYFLAQVELNVCLFFEHRLRNTSTNRFHYNTYTADLPSCTHYNHYAFSVSNMPLRKPVKNVRKSCILQNFSVICPKPYNLQLILTSHQQKMASMQRHRQRHVYFTITISSGVRFCHPVKIKQSRRWNHAQWNEELVALF